MRITGARRSGPVSGKRNRGGTGDFSSQRAANRTGPRAIGPPQGFLKTRGNEEFQRRRLAMLRKGLVLAALSLTLLPAVASAQVRGPFEVLFAASGVNGNDFNGFSGALNFGFGYFITQDQIEISVRQSLQYTDIGARALDGSTRIAADFHF